MQYIPAVTEQNTSATSSIATQFLNLLCPDKRDRQEPIPMSDSQSALQSKDQPPSPAGMKYFLLVFIISIFFFGRILWPFWSILVLSFLLTNLFRPIYIYTSKRLPDSLASALTCLLIIAIVIIPLVFFVFSLADEALNLYS
jgi:hypothetical protein